MELITDRLTLRPLEPGDIAPLTELIFSDPEVAKGLFHDISRPAMRGEHARRWCESVGQGAPVWDAGGMGGFAILSRDAEVAPPGTVLGSVGVFDPEHRETGWYGELFYALGRAYHGKGLMSEAARAVLSAFAALDGQGELYAVYWGLLNPASGRVLRGLGFTDAGYERLDHEYGAARALTLLDFELWRLREASGADVSRIACEAATKIGHLVEAGLLDRDTARADLVRAVDGRLPMGYVSALSRAFEMGLQRPGLARMEWRAT